MKLKGIIAILTLFFFSACIGTKINYIHDKNEAFEKITEYDNHPPDYKLKTGDILYVKISSSNKEINESFNQNTNYRTNANNNNNIGSFYLNGFTVNDSGFIKLPILGNIKVIDLTVNDINKLVQQKTDEHLNKAIVTVKLVSFYLTFLGEINSKGRISVNQENIDILDGIALAGGINDYGNKKDVLIVRQTANGNKTIHVDLTKRDLLTSKHFYLLPNDKIIVPPLKNKTFRLNVMDYTLILTTLTSTVTTILLILNLRK